MNWKFLILLKINMLTNALTNQTAEKKSTAVANDSISHAPTLHNALLQPEDHRPQAMVQRKLQAIANDSPQVKQSNAMQAMANGSWPSKKNSGASSGKVIQGYFKLFDEKTNDPDADLDDLWLNLKNELIRLTVTGAFVEEFKTMIMGWARDNTNRNLDAAVKMLKNMEKARLKGEGKMSAESRTGMTSTSPELVGDKEKHTAANYTFRDESAEGGTVKETLDLDKYTKKGESDLTAGTWTKADMLVAIRVWSCKAPLVQHLAQFVLPKLKVTDRKWEMYLREMERVLEERATEAKNKEFVIRSADQSKSVDFKRSEYEVRARTQVREKLIAGEAPPGSQNDIPFFDDLIRTKLTSEGVANWYTTVAGTQLTFDSSKIEKNPGMTLVHWRTMLLFDWQVGNEVWKNGV